MGGWGVDALVGRVTRNHKDVDLLVQVADLARFGDVTRAAGFVRRFEWSENRRIEVDGVAYDSAFVDADRDGRELDVHVVDVQDNGRVVQFHTDPWPLPVDSLAGEGSLAGRRVRCVSRAAQLAMHRCYILPAKHRQDVELLLHIR
jgi:lincosamide nucleotidyltransferase A/C/D/E